MSTLASTMTHSSSHPHSTIGRSSSSNRMNALNHSSQQMTNAANTNSTPANGSFSTDRYPSQEAHHHHHHHRNFQPPRGGTNNIKLDIPDELLSWSDFKIAMCADRLTVSKEVKKGLRRCILDGIPDEDRPLLWKFLTGASLKLKINKGYYQGLLRCLDRVTGGAKSKSFDQIEKDLPRTFPEEAEYSNADFIQSLRNILRAYAM
mmetsp:Transcript_60502/g.69012  ORF Transcript_60502/g.69012 Transcript_60502/m.69012 type:complete len:205 (+) Transcript_60502:49-663(+)